MISSNSLVEWIIGIVQIRLADFNGNNGRLLILLESLLHIAQFPTLGCSIHNSSSDKNSNNSNHNNNNNNSNTNSNKNAYLESSFRTVLDIEYKEWNIELEREILGKSNITTATTNNIAAPRKSGIVFDRKIIQQATEIDQSGALLLATRLDEMVSYLCSIDL